ncbi:hypothetical protein [Pseudomonas fluorescens]|uniref:Uncharacterized protein n=1 Tax=Pseudomonas fluorescens TaxID=294 RepID=A0A5E7GMT2_PSEFL|nr:hypothetical protein [Pseudomonas fluorescens]VVO52918.1 hypothetical protein PS880_00392 [Pseudomonas fluorescens]
MNDDDDVKDTQAPTDDLTTDTEAVDETLTPSSPRAKEEATEELDEKIAEIERHVADGN